MFRRENVINDLFKQHEGQFYYQELQDLFIQIRELGNQIFNQHHLRDYSSEAINAQRHFLSEATQLAMYLLENIKPVNLNQKILRNGRDGHLFTTFKTPEPELLVDVRLLKNTLEFFNNNLKQFQPNVRNNCITIQNELVNLETHNAKIKSRLTNSNNPKLTKLWGSVLIAGGILLQPISILAGITVGIGTFPYVGLLLAPFLAVITTLSISNLGTWMIIEGSEILKGAKYLEKQELLAASLSDQKMYQRMRV